MSADADRIDVVNPATEEVLDSLPLGSAAEVDAAVERAGDAFPAWAATPLPERLGYLSALADELERRADDLVMLITAEVGTPLAERSVDRPGHEVVLRQNLVHPADPAGLQVDPLV